MNNRKLLSVIHTKFSINCFRLVTQKEMSDTTNPFLKMWKNIIFDHGNYEQLCEKNINYCYILLYKYNFYDSIITTSNKLLFV